MHAQVVLTAVLLLSGPDGGPAADCTGVTPKLDQLSAADTDAFLSCAEDLEQSGQTAPALEAYRRLRTAARLELDAWQAEVRLLIRLGRAREAREVVEQWDEATAGWPWALALREELATSPTERKAAAVRFNDYLAGLEKGDPLSLMVGEVFADRRDWKRARGWFERGAGGPRDIWARYGVAVSSIKLGDWKRADREISALSKEAATPLDDGPNVPPALIARLRRLRAEPKARAVLGLRAAQELKPAPGR